MATSQTNIAKSRLAAEPEVTTADLAYMGAWSRHLAHELVVDAFERSGLSKAELARRLNCDKSQLGKWLNVPANITVETLGQLLFAIDKSSPTYGRSYPMKERETNACEPEWLHISSTQSAMKVAAHSTAGSATQTSLTYLAFRVTAVEHETHI